MSRFRKRGGRPSPNQGLRAGRKRAPAVSAGRQRILNQDQSSPAPYLYRSRRSDELFNTGRQEKRPEPKKSLKLASVGANFWLQRLGLIIFVSVVLVSVVSILSLSSTPRIIEVASNPQLFLHSSEDYQSAGAKLLAGSIFNRNKITIDTAQLSRQLSTEFPELSSVTITLPLLTHRPIFYISPAQPALVLTSGQNSYIIDTNGKALSSYTHTKQPISGLPLVNNLGSQSIAPGHQVLSGQDVSFILGVVAELAAKHITVSTFSLPAGTRELDAHINGQPYYVKFNLQSGDARQQAGTYLATLSQLQGQGTVPGQYIDVRLDGRAYYK